MHAALLRDVVRERSATGLADAWRERTEAELEPFYRASVATDRARLAAMEAYREGREPPAPADAAEAVLRAALSLAMGRDADAFRAGLEIIGCLAPPDEVLARPGLAERVLALARTRRRRAGPRPRRLLQLVA